MKNGPVQRFPIRVTQSLYHYHARFCDVVVVDGEKWYLETKLATGKVQIPMDDFFHQIRTFKKLLPPKKMNK